MSFKLAIRPSILLRKALPAAVVFSSVLCALPARAASIDERVFEPQALADLELRASQAKPREQCFLYAELVHSMTEVAGRQLSDGDTEHAAATLQRVNKYAHLIHANLANDTKRVKDAEQLMHHTAFRLAEYLHLVSEEDKVTVQATLKQVKQVNDELLTQVFSH